MTQKIDGLTPGLTRSVEPAKAGGKSPGGAVGPAAAPDKVQLTGDAHVLSELEQQIASLPVEDAGRIASVSAALADGSYRVDADAVAGKLIGLERALHGKG